MGAILKALEDPRKEVLEIVLQNLISSSLPTHDTLISYKQHLPILAGLSNIIDRCESTDQLISVSCLLSQYLMTARHFRKTGGKDAAEIEALIRKIIDPKKPAHFFYARRLIKLYEVLPPIRVNDGFSLLPQPIESLIGWGRFPHSYREVLSHLALIQARTAFVSWSKATGKDSTEQDILSQPDAVVAWKKNLAFASDFSFLPLLKPFTTEKFQIPETGFQDFLAKTYVSSLEDTDFYDDQRDKLSTVKHLSTKVPFWLNSDQLIPYSAYASGEQSGFSEFIKNALVMVGGFTTGILTSIALFELFCRFVCRYELTDEELIELKDNSSSIIEVASETQEKISKLINNKQERIDAKRGRMNIE